MAAADVLDDHRQPATYEPDTWGPDDALRLADPVGWVLAG